MILKEISEKVNRIDKELRDEKRKKDDRIATRQLLKKRGQRGKSEGKRGRTLILGRRPRRA